MLMILSKVFEILHAQGLAPEFGPNLLNHVHSGGAGFGCWFSPFWQWQRAVAFFKSSIGGEDEDCVGEGCKLRLCLNGVLISDLSFSDSDDLFFITDIHFDFPSPDKGLDERFQRRMDFGGNKERWFAVQELAPFARAISEWSDDNQAQWDL